MVVGVKVPSGWNAPTELTTTSNGLGGVSEIQRTRMLMAMAEVACERGADDVAVAHVVERAGVSRRTFYEIFKDREDCFLATFEEAIARAFSYVSAADDPRYEWAPRIRSELEALLSFLEHEPALGRLAVVESLSAGAKALELRRDAIDRLVAAIDEGRESMSAGYSATGVTAEGLVGGVVSVIHGRLVSEEDKGLMELANPLMSMIVLPYLGPEVARKELERSVAKPSARALTPSSNPLKDLDMRLTYRTVRALTAVAAKPGSSNRVIGDVCGVGDQGQISKLLARLEKLGLVENARTGAPNGATNVWSLTERGEGVANVIATQATSS